MILVNHRRIVDIAIIVSA